ncbi:MAG: xanthine dehydrogenase small subunit [Rubrivivax sp.]|nr:xanthine dehydrogenase small subunit [Rubrivivax sp.]
MNPTRPIRFFHRGAVVEIADAAPTRTVLQWLREDRHCTGTKEGCAEGDCGACTVVLGELGADGALQLKPVNACIQFLPTLDGKALFTVEDLAAPDGTLHPAQQAMVDCHGSQCGFCTPGFVMSLWAGHEKHAAAGTVPTRQQLADELSGNLCRCTGYRPILDAGQKLHAAAVPPQLERGPVEAALKTLAAAPPLHYETPAGRFHAPRTLDELAALRAARPEARVLAGSTDVGLWVTKQFRALPELIYVGEVAELRRIDVGDTQITLGAGASLEAAWSALAAEWPALRDVWLRFASLPVRQAGTMGGNVANGSPIGDSAPVLIALGATIVLRQGARVRRLALEDFYVDYMKNRLEAGEFVQALEVPRRGGRRQQLRVYKISKRFDCDISAVCAALAIELDGERVAAVRLAFGGMAGIVKRAAAAEAALVGQAWTEAALVAAQAALATDFTPLTDLRASAAYRLQVSQNLLRRFWMETRPVDPLPEAAVTVWARGATA